MRRCSMRKYGMFKELPFFLIILPYRMINILGTIKQTWLQKEL